MPWLCASLTSDAAAVESTGSSTIDLGALRDHRVELLLLLRRVGVGVLVDHLAGRAELLHLGLEAGVVVLLVAGRAPGRASERRRWRPRRLRRMPPCRRAAKRERCGAGRFQCESGHCVFSLSIAMSSARSRCLLQQLKPGRSCDTLPVCGASSDVGQASRRGRVRAPHSRFASCFLPFPPAQAAFAASDVLCQQRPEARRRHALLRQELAVEIGDVVVADREADLGDRSCSLAHQQLAGEVDAQPVDILHQRHAGVAAEAAREGAGAAPGDGREIAFAERLGQVAR